MISSSILKENVASRFEPAYFHHVLRLSNSHCYPMLIPFTMYVYIFLYLYIWKPLMS